MGKTLGLLLTFLQLTHFQDFLLKLNIKAMNHSVQLAFDDPAWLFQSQMSAIYREQVGSTWNFLLIKLKIYCNAEVSIIKHFHLSSSLSFPFFNLIILQTAEITFRIFFYKLLFGLHIFVLCKYLCGEFFVKK